MKTQIVLDIETTGINFIEDKPFINHKIIEIAAIKIINKKISNQFIHFYLNPNRKIDINAYKIHGINNQQLINKPIFKNIADKLINFIKNTELLIHNAQFDISFIEHELKLINHKYTNIKEICTITDTLLIARKLFPGKKNDLDTLQKRYHINHIQRKKHNALLDSKLLSIIYLNMTRKQKKIPISLKNNQKKSIYFKKKHNTYIKYISSKDLILHKNYLIYILKTYHNCIWLNKTNKKN